MKQNIITSFFALLALVMAFKPSAARDGTCVSTTHGCIATNSDVTQATIKQTICLRGYTKEVRPAVSYTNGVKKLLMKRQGIDLSRIHEYELDHIIPLELGGHPRSLTNLQLQLWEGATGARAKDKLEDRLHGAVCRGRVPLAEAQRCIGENWISCAAKYPGKRDR